MLPDMRRRLLVSLLLVLAVPALHAGDERWNRFRGPDGTGVAPDGVRLPDALDPERNRAWSQDVPPGVSSPCLTEERLFLTGAEEHSLITLALDRRDGKVLWRRELPAPTLERTHEVHGPASPTPTSDGRHVIVYFGSSGLVCYDLEGQEVWRRELPIPKNTFGSAASPILAGERLIFVSDANEGSYLEALDPEDGRTLWRRERTDFVSGWSTPGLRAAGNGTELLVYGAFALSAYDLADGTPRWSVPGLADEPIVTPIAGAELVYVTSYNMKVNPEVSGLPTYEDMLVRYDHDGNGSLNREEAAENDSVLSRPDADGEGDHPLRIFFRFLDVNTDGEIDAEEWKKLIAWVDGFSHANGLIAIRPGDLEHPAEIAWQFSRGVPECPSPLHYRGRLYMVMNGGLVTCLDAASGKEVYQERLGARGPYYASLVAGDGKLFAASARGELCVFTAGDDFKLLSRTDLGERLMATPALSQGRVYVRTEGRVHAFERPE